MEITKMMLQIDATYTASY